MRASNSYSVAKEFKRNEMAPRSSLTSGCDIASDLVEFDLDKARPERLWSVVLATFIAAMGPLSFGYGMGYSSAAITQLDAATAPTNSSELHLDVQGITWFGVRKTARLCGYIF